MRMRDKTAGIATTHKFSSILIPRRTEAPRTTRVSITPTVTQPDARKMYSLTIIVKIIIGYGLRQGKCAVVRGGKSIPLTPFPYQGKGVDFGEGQKPHSNCTNAIFNSPVVIKSKYERRNLEGIR